MPDQLIAQMLLDQGFMDSLAQAPCGKLVEGAREGGLGRQAPVQRETTDAAQETVIHQAIEQPHRRRQAQHRLGDKGVRQPRPLKRRTADTTPRHRRELLDPHPLENVDDPLQLRRQRAPACLKFRDQFVLHHIPPVQQPASCAIVRHGRRDQGFDAPIMPEMAACHPPSQPLARKNSAE
jgi:hypothetical protein